jgi:hypothetical protein
MPSSYKSFNLFGSGPHRFAVRTQGLFTPSNTAINGSPTPGSTVLGPLELEVVVTGRLVAASESALWTLVDAITAQLVHPNPATTPGTLIDEHGRTFTGMTFITFTPEDRTDRGRVHSLAYEALFRRLL